jgi:hypothetical protein
VAVDEKSFTLRIKINMTESFNAIISGINRTVEIAEERDDHEYELPKQLQIADVRFEIILGYMKEIAERALELQDPKLI